MKKICLRKETESVTMRRKAYLEKRKVWKDIIDEHNERRENFIKKVSPPHVGK